MREFDIGFLGGGQLARMSIMAAQRMGLRCISLDQGADTPASQIAPAIQGALALTDKIAQLAACSHRLTLENEFIPADALRRALSDPSILLPGIETLATVQDKLAQRRAYLAAGVPSPEAAALEADASEAIERIGFPMVLKARFGGYDGKGTRFARSLEELESHRHLWQQGGWLAETWIEFRRELAVMAFVSRDGREVGAFPAVETVQKNGVCDLVLPLTGTADIPVGNLNDRAIAVAKGAVEAVEGRGLFGVELFETAEGEILVNEIAPRPHNSGHYTLDWDGVSQFEQHVRLVMDLPLGKAEGQPVVMANLFGQTEHDDFRKGLLGAMQGDPGVRVHWYGKSESRPGRKMGHINVVGGNDLVERAIAARERFYRAFS